MEPALLMVMGTERSLAASLMPLRPQITPPVGKSGPAFRRRIRGNFSRVFQKVDVIVTPQLPITAPKINQGSVSWGRKTEAVPSALTRFTRIYNLVGMPSLSIPCGFSTAGLPIGLRVAGKPFDEAMVLKVGHAYESNTPWKNRHPPHFP
jgi:aspartyl-tRNA(Asn)/glutamyl-tRNA(Gln) amidotransferase subunit A